MLPSQKRLFPGRLGRAAVRLLACAALIASLALLIALRVGPDREPADPPPAALADSGATSALPPGQPPVAEAASTRTPLPGIGASSTQVSARPRGVVLDAQTREPLPAYRLGVYSVKDRSSKGFSTTSGANGVFQLDTELPFGKLRFELIDDLGLAFRNREYITKEFAPGATAQAPLPIELLAACGPTCFFELEFPAGLSFADFDVRLLGRRPFPGSFYPQDSIHAALRAPNAATLHPQLPWVRFGMQAHLLGMGFVELRSRDGRWHAGSWIENPRGVHADPLKIAFEGANWLVAHVPIPAGAAAVGAAFRLIERLPEGSKQHPRKYSASSNAQGELRFDFLEPGEYRLFTHSRDWFPFERDITIVPGANDQGTIALVPRPEVGSIRGTIESKSGKYEGACHVSLSNTPFEHDAIFDHSLDFEDDGTGRLVAAFELENVTAGEWFLYVHCHDGFVHTQSLRTVIAPADDVHIVLEDLSATVEIVLLDATSGELLGEDSALTWQVGEANDRADGPRVRLEGMPDSPERITFLAEAPGYRPRRGTGADFERIPGDGNSAAKLRAVCKLERGFGGVLLVRDRSSGSPIDGAEIFIDGALAGTSNADGEFWIELKARPERIRVAKNGWRWVSSENVDSKTGRLGDGPEFYAGMERFE